MKAFRNYIIENLSFYLIYMVVKVLLFSFDLYIRSIESAIILTKIIQKIAFVLAVLLSFWIYRYASKNVTNIIVWSIKFLLLVFDTKFLLFIILLVCNRLSILALIYYILIILFRNIMSLLIKIGYFNRLIPKWPNLNKDIKIKRFWL